MPDAHIKPQMLQWAMSRAGASPADVAPALGKSEDTVREWLGGTAVPTFRQAQKLAKRLRVPFGYLFLSQPPSDDLPLPDFRRGRQVKTPTVSVDLRDVLSDVLRKQDWYRDFREDSDLEPLPFVGSYELGTAIGDVAQDIAQRLDFELSIRPESQPASFLRAFVVGIEALEILVMRNGIVKHATNRALDVHEFRGFSIADPMAPVIFVNNADSNAAQAFTLAHELAHIWIGRSGISDADPAIKSDESDVEEYCNAVAAEVLVPWARLNERWVNWSQDPASFLTNVARDFHVSTVMVARQLWAHDAIDREEFFRLYEAEKANWLPSKSEGSGGNFYLSVPIRNSRLLTAAILDSVGSSDTSIRDASRMLGVKPANLPKLREFLSAG